MPNFAALRIKTLEIVQRESQDKAKLLTAIKFIYNKRLCHSDKPGTLDM